MNSPVEVMTEHWEKFRTHRPVGAYLPVGQLDGDCRACGGAWPCEVIIALFSEPVVPA